MLEEIDRLICGATGLERIFVSLIFAAGYMSVVVDKSVSCMTQRDYHYIIFTRPERRHFNKLGRELRYQQTESQSQLILEYWIQKKSIQED
ncbi:hypothetical protein BpHYR1_004830 [Brachionus plicatilis]|uniref:Uncharacterized protein n=1 Tax=Brachionus plicatilis TaxID=10195 RepID=A0A3M7QMP7_BRAPC|nr:hypothetical protein BpHYR1_004830 [Brachionus plicatilis]